MSYQVSVAGESVSVSLGLYFEEPWYALVGYEVAPCHLRNAATFRSFQRIALRIRLQY